MFDSFIGQSVEVEDSSNLDQCMDWAFKICDLKGIPRSAIRNLRAKDVWTNHDPNYLTASATPTNGCFAIWGSQVGVNGHIAWVESGSATNFTSLDQNWNGILRVERVQHTGFGVLGFLIPKGNDVITKDQENVLAIMATGSYPGKDYNYQFTGLPLTQTNLDHMLQFWQGQIVNKPTTGAVPLAPGVYEVK